MSVTRKRQSPAPAAEVALLESKLVPPPERPGVVPRPALVERLRWRHRSHPVAILEAGAGYGKTTLAVELAASDPRPTGWYTLDELDNDPTVFLTYLARVLERCGGLGEDIACIAAPDVAPDVAGECVHTTVATIPRPTLIVLDNVHLLHDATCLRCIEAVATGLSPGSQLLLATRWTPAISPHAWDRAVRLDTSDLRLSAQEIEAVLRAGGLEVDANEARALEARCEGWAAGVCLVAQSKRDAADSLVDEGEATVDRFVDDYFHAEVLDGMDSEISAFLRDVSVLDRVSGTVADSVVERAGSADLLAELADLNLFVTRSDDAGEWYTLHPLLRDLLRAELRHAEPAWGEQLLERAVDWFEERGDLDTAAEYAIATTNLDRAAALVCAAAPSAYRRGRERAVERWLARLDDPDVLVANRPLAAVGAGLLALLGHAEAASRWGALAESAAHGTMPDGSPDTAWSALLRASLCVDGVERMLEDAHAARELLAESSPLGVGALLCAGFAELLTGDTAAAEASLRATADRAAQLGVPAGASVALAVLSLQAASGGDLDAAERHARRAADVVSRGGLERHVSASIVHAAVARAALVQRRVSTAQRATQLADPLVRSTTYALPWFASYVRLELAQVQLALGESGSARELLAGAEDVVARRPGLGLIEDRIVSLRRDLRFGRTVADGSTTTLTAAELRLLPLLPSYLSFREIADRLGISRNTVKTQAISVYRKLGVKSRTAVVERAQTLGLLDSKSAQADNG